MSPETAASTVAASASASISGVRGCGASSVLIRPKHGRPDTVTDHFSARRRGGGPPGPPPPPLGGRVFSWPRTPMPPPARAGSAVFPPEEMGGFYGAISPRRDIRHFRPDPLAEELLWRLLEAAHHAPSV